MCCVVVMSSKCLNDIVKLADQRPGLWRAGMRSFFFLRKRRPFLWQQFLKFYFYITSKSMIFSSKHPYTAESHSACNFGFRNFSVTVADLARGQNRGNRPSCEEEDIWQQRMKHIILSAENWEAGSKPPTLFCIPTSVRSSKNEKTKVMLRLKKYTYLSPRPALVTDTQIVFKNSVQAVIQNKDTFNQRWETNSKSYSGPRFIQNYFPADSLQQCRFVSIAVFLHWGDKKCFSSFVWIVTDLEYSCPC